MSGNWFTILRKPCLSNVTLKLMSNPTGLLASFRIELLCLIQGIYPYYISPNSLCSLRSLRLILYWRELGCEVAQQLGGVGDAVALDLSGAPLDTSQHFDDIVHVSLGVNPAR